MHVFETRVAMSFNSVHVSADQCSTVATASATTTKLWRGRLMHGMGMSRHAYALLSSRGPVGA